MSEKTTGSKKKIETEPKITGFDLRPIDDLIPYASNSRTHSDAQIAQLAGSIDEWGMVGAIVIRDGVIAKGHGTYAAISRLYAAGKPIYPAPGKHADPSPPPYPDGMVPVIDATGWSDAQFRAYVIADNKLAEKAGWDESLLAIELQGLKTEDFDMTLLGFDADELVDAMQDGSNFKPGDGEGQSKLDKKAPIICPECGHEWTPS